MGTMQPLSQILKALQSEYQITLHRTNLAARTLLGPNGQKESVLDQLARDGMAETVEHGQRRLWYISSAAIPRLVDLAKGARPGPAPGTQITLDAAQLRELIRYLAATPDPADVLRAALAAVTGWDEEAVNRAERIVIPLDPRRR